MDEIIELGKPIELRFISPSSSHYSINIDEVLQFLSQSISLDRDYFDSVTESLRLAPKEKIQTELISY
jgi:hypothetical protein